MRAQRRLLSVVLAVLALHGHGAGAQDDDDDEDDDAREDTGGVTCSSGLGDVRVRGDLRIATRCQLSGTEVRGDVILFEGGALIARDVRVRGKIEGSRADFVDVERSRVDGTIRLQGLVGDESRIEHSDVHGETAIIANRSRFELLNNEFHRTLRIEGNTGGVLISGNSVDGNLECSGNRPPPTGLGNRVDGEARGQCDDLRADSETEPPASSPPPTSAPTTTTPPPPRTPSPPSTPAIPPHTAAPPPEPSPPPTPAPDPPPTPTPAPPSSSSPPPTAAPPASTPAPPPAAAPPATATPPPTQPDPSIADEGGGAGALGFCTVLLLPLLGWRRFGRRARQP